MKEFWKVIHKISKIYILDQGRVYGIWRIVREQFSFLRTNIYPCQSYTNPKPQTTSRVLDLKECTTQTVEQVDISQSSKQASRTQFESDASSSQGSRKAFVDTMMKTASQN